MWEKVFEGQEVQHSAQRENAVTDILNHFPAISGKSLKGQVNRGVCLTGFAAETLPAYVPVAIGHANADKACILTPDPAEEDFWGITADLMLPTVTGLVILQGITPALIRIEQVDHRFAKIKDGSLVSCEEKTSCRILSLPEEAGEQICTVFLDLPDASIPECEKIHTDFAVTLNEEDHTLSVSGGYLNRNGTLLTIQEKKQITPQTGTLCLQSILKEKEDGTSQWSEPAFVFCPVACNAWPVAEITVQKKEDGSETITIRQRITNVAMILQTKPCPLTTVGALQK